MTEAAQKFLASLAPAQQAKTTFSYHDGERIFWYYPPLNRHGISLKELNQKQRDLAFGLMSSSLTEKAYQQARAIMDHESILGPLEKKQGHVTWERDPELYSWRVFSQPDIKGPWGWSVEGHHVSLHFSVFNGEVISMTPFFFGANPAQVPEGAKRGLRILAASEDLAFDLMNSLDAGQRSKAIINPEAPWDILTYNASRASFMPGEGLPASRLNGTQKEMLMAVIAEYVSRVRTDLSQQKLAQLRQQGLDHLHLSWAGPTQKGQAHYYRIAGGNFMIEFDNRQNGANHIHSVWRDVENDFGLDVMRDHLLLYHNV
jgi:hypothetical protein